MDMKFFVMGLAFSLLPCTAQQPAPQQASEHPTLRTPNQEQARNEAETVYSTWRQSMINHNYAAWTESTSESRQVKVRNLAVSEKREFPRSLFEQKEAMPPLSKLKYVGALGGPRGDTLAATYYGPVDMGRGIHASDGALVLLFVYERGKWKYDQSRFFDLAHLPQVKARLARGDASVLREQDGFHPYATPPATPPLCRTPQLIGKVFVDAPDRKVTMTVNGTSQHVFENCRMAEVISGGLVRGRNTISYTVTPLNGKKQGSPMAIGLFVMPETVGNTPATCFEHICDEQDIPHGGTYTFTVTDDMIRAMNPKANVPRPAPFRPVPLKPKKK